MIISHKFQHIFVHIQKSGGLSIENQFCNVNGLDPKAHYPGHTSLLDLKFHKTEHYPKLAKEEYRSYYRWTIVRNPFDRCVSAYWHYIRSNFKEARQAREDSIMPKCFEEYLLNDRLHVGKLSQADQITIRGCVDCHVFRFEDGHDGIVKAVSTALNERISSFPVIDKCGQRHNIEFREDKRHYREIITPACRAIIEKMHKKDLKVFGYEW